MGPCTEPQHTGKGVMVVFGRRWKWEKCEKKKVKTQEAAAVKTLIVFKAQFLLSVCHSFALLHGWFKDQQQQKQE